MGQDLKRITTFSDKVKYLFKKPGWLPDYLGGYRSAPEVDKSAYRKYETPAPILMNWYVLFQYILCLLVTGLFLFKAGTKTPDNLPFFTMPEKVLITGLIAIVVVNCGVLFEQRVWVKWVEWIRIFVYPVLLSVFTFSNGWPVWLHGVAALYFAISFIWFYSLQKHAQLQMA